MDEEKKTQVALWRFSVLGPLVSARLCHGDRRQLCREAAGKLYEGVNGRLTELSARTVETWYYRWRKGGLAALKPSGRADSGRSRSIRPEMAELVVRLKEHNPRRSIRRIIRILERAGKVRRGELSKSSVHRLLQARGISGLPGRHDGVERRAFRHERAGDLWMGDVMHGPRVIVPSGRLRKAYLHLFIDSATRLVPSCAFRLTETAVDHEAVFKQGLIKHGLPRVLYLDRGSAQTADSLKHICGDLGIRLLHCRPYDPSAKAGVERIFKTARAEILDELPNKPLSLEELNSILWAWVSAEYHKRRHSGTGKSPLEHWLSQAGEVRPTPPGPELDRIFLHRAYRKVRKDSTVRFEGRMLEVRSELCGRDVELRYDPQETRAFPKVFVDGKFYCDTTELDPIRNSCRRRRRRPAGELREPEVSPCSDDDLDPLKLIQQDHHRIIRSPGTKKE